MRVRPIGPRLHQQLALSEFWISTIVIGVWWYHYCFHFNSLIASDVEHPFICLFVICVSFLVRYLYSSFAHFLIGLLSIHLSSFKNSLHILDNNPLSGMSFTNIFSQSLLCLLILSTMSFTEQFLIQ